MLDFAMKHSIFFLILFSCLSSLSAASELNLPGNVRSKLLKEVPIALKDSWSDSDIQKCWSQAKNGDDESLTALHVIGNSLEIIEDYKQIQATMILKAETKQGIIDFMNGDEMKKFSERLSYIKLKLPVAYSVCGIDQ